MKIEGLKKDTAVWVRGYADGLGGIDFLDGERSGMLDCLCEDDILYMSKSDFRLDEPIQPQLEVSQMIFDVIESFDEDVEYLHEHLNHQSDEVREWLTHNERDFYEAWLAYPNITVQKEKLYTVEIPNPNRNSKGCAKFRLEKLGDKVYLVKRKSKDVYQNKDSQKLTEQEIRKDFEWAWQQGFAKEVTE